MMRQTRDRDECRDSVTPRSPVHDEDRYPKAVARPWDLSTTTSKMEDEYPRASKMEDEYPRASPDGGHVPRAPLMEAMFQEPS